MDIGKIIRDLRERSGLSQQQAAEQLEISNVHLSRLENGKGKPSDELLDRCQVVFGVHPFVFAWCEQGDISALPPAVRDAARNLRDIWKQTLAKKD